jgi:glycerol-3-phosphate acyltransferase PlsY
MTVSILLCALLAYLLGSVPTAVWYGQAYFGLDIRQRGSGNAGATNTFRVLGKRAGTIVLLIDVLKGWVATNLALILFYVGEIHEEDRIAYKLAFGMIAVLGHLKPIFADFKGGKGVATLLGMVLSLHPEAALSCLGAFLVVLVVTKYVSLASMVGTFTFPVLLLAQAFGPEKTSLIVFGFAVFALVLWTHQKNIGRLLRGQESRTYLGGRRPRNE